MWSRFLRRFALGLLITGASCTAVTPWAARGPVANPIFVSGNNEEVIAERAVDVLHKYNFEVDSTNQLEGTIATRYSVGSGIIEPWHKDSVGLGNRLQSTLQPIRRKVLVHLVPFNGGYLVSIEALKELEDLPIGATMNSQGGSTFIEDYPMRRDLNLVLGQSTPSGWIPLGRDMLLEQALLCRLQKAYSR
jgi:hypothetical protein